MPGSLRRAELVLAPESVEFQLGRIYRNFGVRTRAQMLVALAAGWRGADGFWLGGGLGTA